jgi:small-conductance mechanosensitive channel
MAEEITIFTQFLGQNTQGDYLMTLGIFLASFIVLSLIDSVITKALQKTAKKFPRTTNISAMGASFMEALHWPLYFFTGIYLSLIQLAITSQFRRILNFLLVLFLSYYISRGVIYASEKLIKRKITKKEEEESQRGKSMLGVLTILIKIIVWSVAFLMVLAYLGIEITPILAGLGVGGIAIALALQNILGDLFAAFAIYFDKPFEEGDFIMIGSDLGVVQKIGIKTTRIKSLQGQELIVSNSEMVSTRINNFKRMPERRVAFQFGVEYATPVVKLKKINDIVKKVTSKVKDVKLDRTHFHKYGDFSIIYEVVYYVNTNDYNKYMDVQQEINLGLKEEFEKMGISFAFPTQTLFLKKETS